MPGTSSCSSHTGEYEALLSQRANMPDGTIGNEDARVLLGEGKGWIRRYATALFKE